MTVKINIGNFLYQNSTTKTKFTNKTQYLRTNSATTFVKSSVSLVKKFPLWSSAVWNWINSQNPNKSTVITVKLNWKTHGKEERFSYECVESNLESVLFCFTALLKNSRQLLDQSNGNAKTNSDLTTCVFCHAHLPRGLFQPIRSRSKTTPIMSGVHWFSRYMLHDGALLYRILIGLLH